MAPAYGDDWTVVTGRRRHARSGMAFSVPHPDQHLGRCMPTRRDSTYADAVKFGACKRPTLTYCRDLHQWSAGPQLVQQQVRPVPSKPAFYRTAPRTGPRRRLGIDAGSPSPLERKRAHVRQDTGFQHLNNPSFGITTRAIVKIIKLVHHRNNVLGDQPPTITRLQHYLTGVIKPALPNPATLALIEGNAKNWAYTTMLILRQHYDDALDVELDKFCNYPPEGKEECYRVAVIWAKRALGRRLKGETIREACTLIRDVWHEIGPCTSPTSLMAEGSMEDGSRPPSPGESGVDQTMEVQPLVHVEVDEQPHSVAPRPEEVEEQPHTPSNSEPPTPPECGVVIKSSLPAGTDARSHPLASSLEVVGERLQAPDSSEPPSHAPSPLVAITTRSVPTMTTLTCFGSPRREVSDGMHCVMPIKSPPPSAPRVALSPDKIASLNTAIQTRLVSGWGLATPSSSQCDTQKGQLKRSLRILRKRVNDELDVQKRLF